MKPKVAFFDFACCEGCQLQIVNLENELLDLLLHVDVVEFREAMSERADRYDIAFIEGSINRPEDEERLKDIRARSGLLVAMGACACTGNINYYRNYRSNEWNLNEVYGKDANLPNLAPGTVKAVDEVVKVDAYLPGCPMNKYEFVELAKSLVLGKKFELPTYPVCVECKKNGNVCTYELGQHCMGPVTRAGCGAACTTQGHYCFGCRGLVPNPNVNAAKDVMQKYGLNLDQSVGRFKTFLGKQGKEVVA
jgi:coenzyme F420-reducing hydrogenase gamma subunit